MWHAAAAVSRDLEEHDNTAVQRDAGSGSTAVGSRNAAF